MTIATLFDFDGVLVDSEPLHLAAFRDVLASRGIEVSDEAYAEKYLGFDDAGAFRAIFRDAGRDIDDAQVNALIEEKHPAFLARVSRELKPFPGAAELVRRRASRGAVAIVSGALEREIRFCLDRMGVLDLVRFIVAADHTTACKPDPQGYLLAMEKLAHEAPRAVVIEDSTAGVEAAKRARLRCVAVTHSYARDALSLAGADAVVDSLVAMTDALLDGTGAR
jgi:HAD superfamily hydrolase (TIGR01509 family)